MKKITITILTLFLLGCGDNKEENDPFANLSNSKKEDLEIKSKNDEKILIKIDDNKEKTLLNEKENLIIENPSKENNTQEVNNNEYEKERIIIVQKEKINNNEYEKERIIIDQKEKINEPKKITTDNLEIKNNEINNNFLKSPNISLKNEKNLSSYYDEKMLNDSISPEDQEYNQILKKIHEDYLNILKNISSQFNLHRETTLKEFKKYEKDILDYYTDITANKNLNCSLEKIDNNEHLCMNYEKQISNIKEQYEILKQTLKEYIDKLNNDEVISFEKYRIQYEKNISNLKQQYDDKKNL